MKNLRSGKLYDNGVNYRPEEELLASSEQKLGAEEKKKEENVEKQPSLNKEKQSYNPLIPYP